MEIAGKILDHRSLEQFPGYLDFQPGAIFMQTCCQPSSNANENSIRWFKPLSCHSIEPCLARRSTPFFEASKTLEPEIRRRDILSIFRVEASARIP
jgi:hypothetical protein